MTSSSSCVSSGTSTFPWVVCLQACKSAWYNERWSEWFPSPCSTYARGTYLVLCQLFQLFINSRGTCTCTMCLYTVCEAYIHVYTQCTQIHCPDDYHHWLVSVFTLWNEVCEVIQWSNVESWDYFTRPGCSIRRQSISQGTLYYFVDSLN